MAGLIYLGQDIVTATFLAITMAYLSNWFGLLLLYLQRKLTILYKKKRDKEERRKEVDRESFQLPTAYNTRYLIAGNS